MKSKLSSTSGTFKAAILEIIQMISFSLHKISRYALNMLTLRTSPSVPNALVWRVPRKISRITSISHTGIMEYQIFSNVSIAIPNMALFSFLKKQNNMDFNKLSSPKTKQQLESITSVWSNWIRPEKFARLGICHRFWQIWETSSVHISVKSHWIAIKIIFSESVLPWLHFEIQQPHIWEQSS